MGEHKIPKKQTNNLWKLVEVFNTQFKSPLLRNVDVSAEITKEGFCIQINERAVELDKNFRESLKEWLAYPHKPEEIFGKVKAFQPIEDPENPVRPSERI